MSEREKHEREERALFRSTGEAPPLQDPAIGYPITRSGLLEMFVAQRAADQRIEEEILRDALSAERAGGAAGCSKAERFQPEHLEIAASRSPSHQPDQENPQ